MSDLCTKQFVLLSDNRQEKAIISVWWCGQGCLPSMVTCLPYSSRGQEDVCLLLIFPEQNCLLSGHIIRTRCICLPFGVKKQLFALWSPGQNKMAALCSFKQKKMSALWSCVKKKMSALWSSVKKKMSAFWTNNNKKRWLLSGHVLRIRCLPPCSPVRSA